MADRALGNPLGNPLGLARSMDSGKRVTVVAIQASGTFEIPARFNFAVLHWFGTGGSGSYYTGGGGGGYAGTKPIKLAGFASRVLTVNGLSCTGLGYSLSSVNGATARDGLVGIGGDYNYKGGNGGFGQTTAYFGTRYGAGGGAAGPSGDGADGAGWRLNDTTYQWEFIPAGRGASGGGGTSDIDRPAGGGGGAGIGGGGSGNSGGLNPPSQGMGSSPFYSPLVNGVNAPSPSSGGAGGLGGGGGGAAGPTTAPGGQFLLVVELW